MMAALPDTGREKDESMDGQDQPQGLDEPEKGLTNIHVTSPEVLKSLPFRIRDVDLAECPASYKENSPKEKRMLAITDNFHRQHVHIDPKRAPMLLCPLNECGVRKCVCTTLRPTRLPYCDLLDWEEIASFVADYLSLEALEPAYTMPRYLRSPTLVIQQRRGSCFEFATLLCSLLLGRGYDVYCVSGYANKEMCLADQSLQQCPLVVEISKELAQRPSDPWHGIWVHCWVLVLSGKQDVRENFFIDPLTGKSYPTTDGSFLGIESLWNHENYWVNMQSCRDGCADMLYDLGDWTRWEAVLCGSDTTTLSLDPESSDIYDNEEAAKDFVMPRSWVKEIIVSPQEKETRYPGGKKVTWYFKAKLERFSPYLQSDGLMSRLTTFTDLAYAQPSVVKGCYQNRNDHLQEREFWKDGNVTIECFKPFRTFHLKFHKYTSLGTEREMEFHGTARVDGLVRRVESQVEMTETFQNRDDFLYYRHVVFGQPVHDLAPGEKPQPGNRALQEVVERFHRDQSKPASKDIKERKFLLAVGCIEVTHHLEDNSIIPATKSFTKPKVSEDNSWTFTSDMVSSFEVNPFAKPSSSHDDLGQMLLALMQEEKNVVKRVKEAEQEVLEILSCRENEESNIELQISLYDKARRHKEHVEHQAAEDQEETEVTILDPFLAQLGNPITLSRQQAIRLHLDCLVWFKETLTEKEKCMKEHLQEETKALKLKQYWYQENHHSINQEDKGQYEAYCSDALLRINVLKQCLIRHKETAPQKIQTLEEKLRHNGKLAPHLLT